MKIFNIAPSYFFYGCLFTNKYTFKGATVKHIAKTSIKHSPFNDARSRWPREDSHEMPMRWSGDKCSNRLSTALWDMVVMASCAPTQLWPLVSTCGLSSLWSSYGGRKRKQEHHVHQSIVHGWTLNRTLHRRK